MATAALLTFGPPGAQAQQSMTPIELNQSLLDKWLVVMPAVIKLGKSGRAPQTDEALRPDLELICADAGFDNYDQCGEVIGYAGMIVSACDRRTGTFRDPIIMLRQEIARIEANKRLSLAEWDKATADLKQIVARFPDNLPKAHLQLMTANRDRVFAALAQGCAVAGLAPQRSRLKPRPRRWPR
jgi:hypothetical protein